MEYKDINGNNNNDNNNNHNNNDKNNKNLIEQLCEEHNKLRKNPRCYIEILKNVLNLIYIKLLIFLFY